MATTVSILSPSDISRNISRHIIDTYFKTTAYPYTRHHINSYDQFLNKDVVSIIQSNNPILILKDLIDETDNTYRYRVEIFVGGETGTEIEIGTPTLSLNAGRDIRIMFPNEARLRNLTYASSVFVNLLVKINYTEIELPSKRKKTVELVIPPDTFQRVEFFKIPIMLHSKYCILHRKPKEFLYQAGECPYDNGGYFIIDGSEKILISRQEQAFNTLYVTTQERDPKIKVYATIICLNQASRQTKRVSFAVVRKDDSIQVQLPFVRKPIPIFTLFRVLGFQSDEEIIQMIFPEFGSDDTRSKILYSKLQPSIIDAFPFFTTVSAIQYIKTLTKGFSEAHVVDIIRNQTFTHMSNEPTIQGSFLGDCVRKILLVNEGFEKSTDKDDTRNQRCLVSGFLVQELFNNVFKKWKKAVSLSIDEEYNYNKATLYKGSNFKNIFRPGNVSKIFHPEIITEGLMRGFKGKWGSGLGEEKTGVLQPLSRLSYCDFMSHCRRVILNFDTTMKMPAPRQLHTSQYGYFCTSETPTGGSIGITKNMTIMAAISTASETITFIKWLKTRGNVIMAENMIQEQMFMFIPVYLNGGKFGYTETPDLLSSVLKLFKRSGCLPYSVSSVFSIHDRVVYIYMDDGRPLRPLLWIDKTGNGYSVEKIKKMETWRDFVMGTLPERLAVDLDNTEFYDPLLTATDIPTLATYLSALTPHTGIIEYIDPYEQNESYIVNYPEHIRKGETTHVEIHPSTILSMMTSMIPFPHHNQSPRNQLSCSQSKQGISVYATNWRNRFDNSAHVLCYGEMPISRSMYTNYLAEGKIPYGMNCILAIGCWMGYNQEDGIVINGDALQRGMFRTIGFRSYQAFEEDDQMTKSKTRFGNPASISLWKDVRPGLDYSKLDERGIIKENEIVDENTVLVGAYMTLANGSITDVSVTPQVWTKGRVEKIAIMVNNMGLRLIKIRIVQDRTPSLGDKFCLTPDHDVLTETGWIPIEKITMDDNVCMLCKDKYIKYVKPTGTYKFECFNEDLYSIKTDDVDLVTTLNHRMYVKRDGAKKFSPTPIKELIGQRVTYKRNGYLSNAPYQFILPIPSSFMCDMFHDTNIFPLKKFDKDRKMDAEAWPEFFGYWYANGWVSDIDSVDRDYTCLYPEYTIVCINCGEHSLTHEKRVTSLMHTLGLEYAIKKDRIEHCTLFIIPDIQLAQYLYYECVHNTLPSWVWSLSTPQCRNLLKGLIANNSFMKLYDGQYFDKCFVTQYGTIAEQVQRLCFHAGWYATIEDKMQSRTCIYQYHVTITKKNRLVVNNSSNFINETEKVFSYTGYVHCLSVPSQVFYVRRNGKAVWTANSNRHGQKGTIGMIIRGHDMPRTISGIVPDMIMNPHAIPSRMTIGQNLEQLLGKTAAVSGMIGDATAFMNDGSPEEQIGSILERAGYEKYGNEVLYNGATGDQMRMSLFIGPVYAMRLKHMVEDKMQARGSGRREQRTHQPTGGRGNQGGLKIGEMDRDAILAHGVSGFFRESYMKRSDGTTMPMCSSCGTIPIYNKRMGISVCPLCDGPVRFVGDSAKNFEILPPVEKPKSKISEIEMPYATKLLGQELETYLNVGLRYITSSDVMHFEDLGRCGEDDERISQPIQEVLFPEVIVPSIIRPVVTVPIEVPSSINQEQKMVDTVVKPLIGEQDQIIVPDQELDNEYIKNIVIMSPVLPPALPALPAPVLPPTNYKINGTNKLIINKLDS